MRWELHGQRWASSIKKYGRTALSIFATAVPSDTLSGRLRRQSLHRVKRTSQSLCWLRLEALLERIVLKVWVLWSSSKLLCLGKGIHATRIAEARTFVLIIKLLARNNIVAALYVIDEGGKAEVLVVAKRY